MSKDRLINVAKDKITGKLLYADELFENGSKVDSFVVRKDYNENKIEPSCLECEQDLAIAHSKYDRNYFRHLPHHSYCILSDNSLSPKDQKEYIEIAKQRESYRHKYLKNRIGELLAEEQNVSNINIDSKYIYKGSERRKPDVYCEYNDLKIVFEIQLSKLPLWYILRRHQFYKDHNIVLIWILDNFDVKDQGSFERDIKYLTRYQNFFKLDETSTGFKLICEFKELFIDKYIVKSKWTQESIRLSQLRVDQTDMQPFYYDYPSIERIKKYELIEHLKQKEEDDFNAEVERKRKEREKKIKNIIKRINDEKLKPNPHYKFIDNDINEMSYLEIQELNAQMDLKNPSRITPPIITWIKRSNEENYSFLMFILQCTKISFDINTISPDGTTPFLAIYINKDIRQKRYFCQLLFGRNYKLQKQDYDFITTSNGRDFVNYQIWNKLKNRNLVSIASERDSFLLILESAKSKEIKGSKLANWTAFANNAIQYYAHYWEYIELAFKKFDIWDLIIFHDTKSSFQQKLQNLYSNFPHQSYDIDECVRDLYPDIFN
ncbi:MULTISPECIES: DUF6035 family protein [Chryseobacterium]|nr:MULTISPECIES: DUF6035 family protein [Chryseobacterium]MBF6643958.1 hypothetical protein [Chryseobacterium indologenes]QQQ72315.1 hypothetical protein JHW31_06220 [Chryseobacterium indologenes]